MLMPLLRNFASDKRGTVAMIFAIALIPMIVVTGGAIDFSRAFDQSTVVQDALDGAALASGKMIGIKTDAEAKAEAHTFFTQNVGAKVNITPTINPVIDASTMTITTELHVPAYFLGLIGINEFVYPLKSQTTQAMGTLEVVMALDNSGSMAGTKISTLITAASDLADTLYGLGATSTKPDPIKVGLVPFASSVKVDPSNKTAAWMDQTGVAPYNAESFEGFTGSPPVSNNTPSGKNVLTMFDTLSGTGSAWAGCVEERKAPYDVQDDAADTSTPATMFVPMFAPDEPDNWTCTTGTCSKTCNSDPDGSSCTSSSTGLRYNGAPTGEKYFNNYLPDVNDATCGQVLTISIANPAVLTRTAHGLTAGTAITIDSTGSLPTGLTEGTTYYVAAAGLTANSFMVTTASTGTNFTVPIVSSPTFTVTSANPAVFTRSSHGLVAGDSIRLSTTGDMYNPLTGGSSYYVIASGLTTNTFRVSTTSGGSALSTSGGGSQSGTHSYIKNAIFTSTGHGLVVGNAVQVSTTGALPTGLTNNAVYYVTSVPTANTFTLSTTLGGVRVYVTGSQSGTHSFKKLVTTTGSQSGTHRIPPTNNDWTCANGAAGCGTGSVGKSEQTALLGQNVPNNNLCKYGTTTNKAAISQITVATNGGTYPGGPNFNCTTDPVVSLTSTKATVKTAIGNMAADGTTNITAGLMWGWRLLSPTAPYTEGRSYATGDNQKILILMTDGENTYFANGKFTVSHYGAWGYIWKSHLGTTSATESTMTGKMEERMALACTNIKAANIKIYTVAFQISDATTKQLLKDCADDPDTMAFDASDPDELTAAFTAIGEDISLLRIAQ